jgi:uncharacterized protein
MQQNQIKHWYSVIKPLFFFSLAVLSVIYFGGCKDEMPTASQQQAETEKIAGTTFEHEGNLTFLKGDSTATVIEIEIAETEGAITQGLMHRESMDFNRGMLFIFPDNEVRSFWMKNTIIPLDIIYVASDFSIVAVKDHTTPYSMASVPSDGKPAQYVVEVNAGFAAKYGLTVGDKMSFTRL